MPRTHRDLKRSWFRRAYVDGDVRRELPRKNYEEEAEPPPRELDIIPVKPVGAPVGELRPYSGPRRYSPPKEGASAYKARNVAWKDQYYVEKKDKKKKKGKNEPPEYSPPRVHGGRRPYSSRDYYSPRDFIQRSPSPLSQRNNLHKRRGASPPRKQKPKGEFFDTRPMRERSPPKVHRPPTDDRYKRAVKRDYRQFSPPQTRRQPRDILPDRSPRGVRDILPYGGRRTPPRTVTRRRSASPPPSYRPYTAQSFLADRPKVHSAAKPRRRPSSYSPPSRNTRSRSFSQPPRGRGGYSPRASSSPKFARSTSYGRTPASRGAGGFGKGGGGGGGGGGFGKPKGPRAAGGPKGKKPPIWRPTGDPTGKAFRTMPDRLGG